MNCASLNTFFSCSFKQEDLEVNNFFKAICEGLELDTRNISEGYSETPPEVAKNLIGSSSLVIAILTKREKGNDRSWSISTAVNQEISMAFTLDKPTLLIVEEGVKLDGFTDNYGTYLSFDRDNLFNTEFLKKTIKSLHAIRMKSMDMNNLLPTDAAGYYAKTINMLIELTKEDSVPLWKYNTSRELVFTKDFNGQIKNVAWVDTLPPEATELIDHKIDFDLSDSEAEVSINELTNTPSKLEIAIGFSETVKKDEVIKINFEYKSKYFSLITKEKGIRYEPHIIEDKHFDALDGMIPIQPTKEMLLQFRFPSWYKLKKDSLFPFVASYSGGIDYLALSELERCQVDITEFAGTIIVNIKIENPLMRHVYGLAWNIKDENENSQ